jgi:hypothetical protein
MTRYMLAAIAVIWMADGLALLCFPLLVVRKVRETLQHSPQWLRWEIVGVWLGLILVLFSAQLPYQPLWWITGVAMVAKGWFLVWGSLTWRTPLLSWCFSRDAIDYRLLGLWLCILAVLLLHALGLLKQ